MHPEGFGSGLIIMGSVWAVWRVQEIAPIPCFIAKTRKVDHMLSDVSSVLQFLESNLWTVIKVL